MRTTVRLDDGLMAEVKRYAAEHKKTVTAVIEEALRETVSRKKTMPPARPVRLTTVGGQGPLSGVDLDDTASLLDLMDQSDATS